MTATETNRTRASGWWIPFAIGAVVIVGLVLRFWTRSDLWLDEAQSVGIANVPFGDLVHALRHDGAPPLYYALLHVWVSIFGDGDLAVRSLSGLFAVATLPLAWFAGRRIGRRLDLPDAGGWVAVLVVAFSPYAVRFATEARMYAIELFLVFAAYLALSRVLDVPSRGRVAVLALVTALLLYTQYWSFFLYGVVVLGLGVRVWRDRSQDPSRRALIGLGIGAVAFLPWVPVLLDQLGHTGTPWGNPRVPWSGLATAFAAFGGFFGGAEHAEAFVLIVPLLVLPLLGLFGAPLSGERIELDLHTRPTVRWEAAAGFGALVLGLTAAWVLGSAFEGRYAAMAFPLILLVAVAGVLVFGDPRVRAGVLIGLVALSLASSVRGATEQRTQASEVADIIAAEAHPGDVVAYCPDQVAPDTSRLLRDVHGLKQLTFPRRIGPERVDWYDYKDVLARSDPDAFARDMLHRAGDHTVWYVNSPGYQNVEGKCEEIGAAFAGARPGKVRVTANSDDFFEFQGLVEYRAR